MNKRSFQTVAVIVVAIAFVYVLATVAEDGTLQNVWSVIKAGHGVGGAL